jgi:hypothetical protein
MRRELRSGGRETAVLQGRSADRQSILHQPSQTILWRTNPLILVVLRELRSGGCEAAVLQGWSADGQSLFHQSSQEILGPGRGRRHTQLQGREPRWVEKVPLRKCLVNVAHKETIHKESNGRLFLFTVKTKTCSSEVTHLSKFGTQFVPGVLSYNLQNENITKMDTFFGRRLALSKTNSNLNKFSCTLHVLHPKRLV